MTIARMPDGWIITAESDRNGTEVRLKSYRELVLCRNCKHWGDPFDKMNGLDVAHCDYFPKSEAFREVFFCGPGERKEANDGNRNNS